MSAVPSIIKKPPPTWALQVPAILAAKPTPAPTWYAETDLWTEPQVLFQGSKLEEVAQRYILCDHVLNFADPAVADVKQLAALTAAATSAKSAAVSGPLSASDALLHAVVDRDSIVFPPPLFQVSSLLIILLFTCVCLNIFESAVDLCLARNHHNRSCCRSARQQ
jgi:hypothetical protein